MHAVVQHGRIPQIVHLYNYDWHPLRAVGGIVFYKAQGIVFYKAHFSTFLIFFSSVFFSISLTFSNHPLSFTHNVFPLSSSTYRLLFFIFSTLLFKYFVHFQCISSTMSISPSIALSVLHNIKTCRFIST